MDPTKMREKRTKQSQNPYLWDPSDGQRRRGDGGRQGRTGAGEMSGQGKQAKEPSGRDWSRGKGMDLESEKEEGELKGITPRREG